MKVPVTITYQKLGTKPPIFIAGSFSDPQWTPEEMEVSSVTEGQYVFTKEIRAREGSEVQYKFRIGLGDWWALDEAREIVSDGQGNQNNLLRVPTHTIDRLAPPDDEDEQGPLLPHERVGIDDDGPLFSHECAGLQDQSLKRTPSIPSEFPSSTAQHGDKAIVNDDVEGVELNDPRLEKFPSEDSKSIFAAVRRLSSNVERNLGDDQDVTAYARQPASQSPSKSLMESLISNKSTSALSLNSIDEREESIEESKVTSNLVGGAQPRLSKDMTSNEFNSDEDEGIAMGNTTSLMTPEVNVDSAEAVNFKPGPRPQPERTAALVIPSGELSSDSSNVAADDNTATATTSSPQIVITPADPNMPELNISKHPTSAGEDASAESTAVDDSAEASLRRRGKTDDQVAAPSPMDSIRKAGREGNWLLFFFRALFVDWIGGLLVKLFGSKRQPSENLSR